MVDRISVEVTRRCGKACTFCYNASGPASRLAWSPEELLGFVDDCVEHGVRAVSFGGGEPLLWPPLFEVLEALRGRCFRSLTTNGLQLPRHLDALVQAAPDKVHVSIHFPEDAAEVARVVRQVRLLQRRGLRSGVNLLVRRSARPQAAAAWRVLRAAGIDAARIVMLPMRGHDTPTPRELLDVTGGERFASMSCLGGCGRSPRFASIGADKTVAWCSYTQTRRVLPSLDHAGLLAALDGLGLAFCGDDGTGPRMVAQSTPSRG